MATDKNKVAECIKTVTRYCKEVVDLIDQEELKPTLKYDPEDPKSIIDAVQKAGALNALISGYLEQGLILQTAITVMHSAVDEEYTIKGDETRENKQGQLIWQKASWEERESMVRMNNSELWRLRNLTERTSTKLSNIIWVLKERQKFLSSTRSQADSIINLINIELRLQHELSLRS